MKRMQEFAARYLIHVLAVGAVAFAGFLASQVRADATQDERLKALEARDECQEHQFELFRRENREDHQQIQKRLDALLSAQRQP